MKGILRFFEFFLPQQILDKRTSALKNPSLMKSTDSNDVQEIRLLPKDDYIIKFIPDKTAGDAVRDGGFVKVDKISKGIGALAEFSAAASLAGSYRMIIPPGAVGRVMQFTTPGLAGAYSATLVGPNGFTSSVGYLPQVAFGAAFLVYSVAAFFTGQFFYVTITKRLAQIQESLEGIRRLIIDAHDSDFDASCQFLQHVAVSSNEIIECERLRCATLGNVQRLSIENRAYHFFNMRAFRAEIERLRKIDSETHGVEWPKLLEVGDKGRERVMNPCRKAALALSLHAYFAAVECELAGLSGSKILSNQFSQIESACNEAREDFEKAARFWESVSHRPQWSDCREVKREQILAVRDECKSLAIQVESAKSSFSSLVEKMRRISEKPLELVWIDGDVFVPSSLLEEKPL